MIFRQDAPSRYPVPQPQALPCAQRSTARAVSFIDPELTLRAHLNRKAAQPKDLFLGNA
jgi:hypothetical protein